MATQCPVCKKGTLKKGEKMVYCEHYKPRLDGKEWYNEGDCDFRIPYQNKKFGKTFTSGDIKKLLEGGTIKNAKGDVAMLDLNNEYFVAIEFAARKEDRDF